MDISQTLEQMRKVYTEDPVRAVRGQHFIKLLHNFIAVELESRLTTFAKKTREITVLQEASIYGSHKAKDVDVAVVDPVAGPLLLVGVRSQMSSIGKNVLTYYQDIIGEAVSLQERLPLSVHAYAYLHPISDNPNDDSASKDQIKRYARMYSAITGRDDRLAKAVAGRYDQFAYLAVDFTKSPPVIRDDVVAEGANGEDLRIGTFVDRIVETFNRRHVWLGHEIFTSPSN